MSSKGYAIFKDAKEIEIMRKSAKLSASVLTMIEEYVKPGITTDELDRICHEYIVSHGAVPAPLGYKGFPKSICTSINRVACHGIPGDKKLSDGDILNIDISLSIDGYFSDTCKMFLVGNVGVQGRRICEAAKLCLYRSIQQVKPGNNIRLIGRAIEEVTKSYKYSIVKDFCGHGVGRALHQEPQILHYDDPMGESVILEPGMTFTIEPIINVGKPDVKILSDGWTVVTKDMSLSAQYEHTLMVTEEGYEVLTLRPEESIEEIMKA
jgi:methionyl aminopeptidase